MSNSYKIYMLKESPFYGSLLTLGYAGFDINESIVLKEKRKQHEQNGLQIDGISLENDASISRFIARNAPNFSQATSSLLGDGLVEQMRIERFICLYELICEDKGAISNNALDEFVGLADICLRKTKFLCGDSPTLADLLFFVLLTGKEDLSVKYKEFFEKIRDDPLLAVAHQIAGKIMKPTEVSKEKMPTRDEGKFVELEGAEMGKVVVRFPPEASGYLHIGHAKAALLNQFYQQNFQGKLILRFDDTNPAKENAHFEEVILEDLEMLHVKANLMTRTSDHFDTLLRYCERLLREGKAFVDDTDAETMRKEREDRAESRNRNKTVEDNMALWAEMVVGSERGQQCCVRIKIDMRSNNGTLRDPTIYRCKQEVHVRHGDKYKVYPTYDFACPIVDSLEGVTHALRTTEYTDRDDQYYFICDALGLRKPHIWAYARLNMTHTVMSKRKLTWLVDEQIVDGWSDPRLPTVRGVMRRGLTVEGLKQFILAQGGSRSVVTMEWDKIWAFNKKVIDPTALRFTALENAALVPVKIRQEVTPETRAIPLHPKNPDGPTKDVWFCQDLLIEGTDADCFKPGQMVTFINWGNMQVVEVKRYADTRKPSSVVVDLALDNKDFKKTLKVTWLPNLIPTNNFIIKTVRYDHIISKAVMGKDEDWKQFVNRNSVHHGALFAEEAMKDVNKGDIVQVQRKSFFICDQKNETSLTLIEIPDGKEGTKKGVETNKSDPAGEETLSVELVGNAVVESKSGGIAAAVLAQKIEEQGNYVREMKMKDPKSEGTKAAIKTLLELKKKYKEAAGQEWKPAQK